jgi:sarcosine oxidase
VERAGHVVVGGGAAGLATVWALARRGREVLLLERFARDHARGSSHGGARILRFAYDDPRYVRLVRDALGPWAELEAESGRTLLDRVGALDFGPAEEVDATERLLAQGGVRTERLSREAARERFPWLAPPGDALLSPQAGRIRAAETLAALAEAAAARGAELRFETGPVRVERAGEQAIVRTGGGEAWRTPSVVLALGAWTPALAADHVALPPLRVTRETYVHLPGPSGAEAFPSFIDHAAPWFYGLRDPAAGIKLGAHMTGAETDPEEEPRPVSEAEAAPLLAWARERLPGVEPRVATGGTCLYTSTEAGHFVLERRGPVTAVSACSGHGFKFTPLVGLAAAALAAGEDGSTLPRP